MACRITKKSFLGLPDNKKIILYSGNIGEKQGLENVIEAAERLRDEPLIFAIVGQGGGKARLEKMAQQRGLHNMQFFPLQSYDALPALLKMGDCHLVVQKRGAADAVLPSKLTNILAVGGNAVITAEDHTELGQLCECHLSGNCGLRRTGIGRGAGGGDPSGAPAAQTQHGGT